MNTNHTHLDQEGNFKSDKYEWCPKGFFALRFSDPKAWYPLRIYAAYMKEIEPELHRDLVKAIDRAESLFYIEKFRKPSM